MALKRKRIIEMLREGFSQSDICIVLHCSKRDVSRLAKMLKDIDIGDDALAALSETELRQLASPRSERENNYVQPDLDHVCAELRKHKVTRKLLWYEYGNTTVPDGMQLYQYSQFCKLIESRLNTESAVMRIKHEPARCAFVDWAGDVMYVRDRITGADTKVYLFVASLPYSGYTYAEGFFNLTQRSWLVAHEHAFGYFCGVPYILVPDCCATAVDRAPIYVTKINSAYMDFAEHYSTAVVPARVRRPRDKSVVEGSVGICEQWVIAALRNQVFFSLAELNDAVFERVGWINERPFKEREGCRSLVFEEEEKPGLKGLPPNRYEHFEMKKAKVSHDYHIQIDYMRYSVDYHLIKQWVDVRISDSVVRIYHGGTLVAEHARLYGRRSQFSTLREHMPPNHQHYDSAWSPERFTKWAAIIGPAASTVIAAVLESKPIVEQTFVSCANILGLAKKGRSDLLEAACGRIVSNGVLAVSYTQVKNLMEAIRRAEMIEADDEDVAECGANSSIGRTRGAWYYRRHRDGDGDGSDR